MTAAPAPLLVRTPDGPLRVARGAGGISLHTLLARSGLDIAAACGGRGACGGCTVRVLSGTPAEPSARERALLGEPALARGLRLACQLDPRDIAEVELDLETRASGWEPLSPAELMPSGAVHPDGDGLGLAIDLGTTHIRMSLWDLALGRRLGARSGRNPQACHGADVLARIDAAAAGGAEGLAQQVRSAILAGLRDIQHRDLGGLELAPRVERVVVVGNTAMLLLLAGDGATALRDPANWEATLDVAPRQDGALHGWGMPNATIELAPPLAGFVGSDLLADLLATRLAEGPSGALLLDIGTNTELALWDGSEIWTTSVPGGPAFEASGLRHGTSARHGAIVRVERRADQTLRAVVDGDGPARGYCGSGLVDACAKLLDAGRLKPSGRFAQAVDGEGLLVDPEAPRSALRPADIDALQRAKAATAAAIEELCARAGTVPGRLARLCVCGVFGRTLDLASAVRIGLLPDAPDARIEFRGQAALAGCEQLLADDRGTALLHPLAARCRTLNVSTSPDYEDRFIANLRLAPMPPGGDPCSTR